MRSIVSRVWLVGFALLLGGIPDTRASSVGSEVIISVPDQELAFVSRGKVVARYPVSTSKFGIGDQPGSYRTPLGTVSAKVGDGLPAGAVIKSRTATGEVLAPNAPGRDPIVSRVMWLRGKESQNANARVRVASTFTALRRRAGSASGRASAASGCARAT